MVPLCTELSSTDFLERNWWILWQSKRLEWRRSYVPSLPFQSKVVYDRNNLRTVFHNLVSFMSAGLHPTVSSARIWTASRWVKLDETTIVIQNWHQTEFDGTPSDLVSGNFLSSINVKMWHNLRKRVAQFIQKHIRQSTESVGSLGF